MHFSVLSLFKMKRRHFDKTSFGSLLAKSVLAAGNRLREENVWASQCALWQMKYMELFLKLLTPISPAVWTVMISPNKVHASSLSFIYACVCQCDSLCLQLVCVCVRSWLFTTQYPHRLHRQYYQPPYPAEAALSGMRGAFSHTQDKHTHTHTHRRDDCVGNVRGCLGWGLPLNHWVWHTRIFSQDFKTIKTTLYVFLSGDGNTSLASHLLFCFLLVCIKWKYFFSTDTRSSAPVLSGQLLWCFLCVRLWNQKISDAGAACWQRDTGLLHIHGTKTSLLQQKKIT